jgi:RNA polymerase sigma factor (sigma-70 family)
MAAVLIGSPELAEHGPLVLRVCTAILGDPELGADAAQETWLKLLRHGDRRSISNLGAWLRRAAVTTALDCARRRQIRAVESLPEEIPGPAPDPARTARLLELRRHLHAAAAKLPEAQRTVFLLRHEGGLPLREIAEIQGLSLPTVKTHFARACVRLQAALRPHLDPEPMP